MCSPCCVPLPFVEHEHGCCVHCDRITRQRLRSYASPSSSTHQPPLVPAPPFEPSRAYDLLYGITSPYGFSKHWYANIAAIVAHLPEEGMCVPCNLPKPDWCESAEFQEFKRWRLSDLPPWRATDLEPRIVTMGETVAPDGKLCVTFSSEDGTFYWFNDGKNAAQKILIRVKNSIVGIQVKIHKELLIADQGH